jgi:transcription factor WhiB
MLRSPLPDWTRRGNCAQGQLDERFFAEETSDGRFSDDIIAAKAVCFSCPVKGPCLEWAYANERSTYREGLYAGTTGPERERFSESPENIWAYLDEQARVIPGIRPERLRCVWSSQKLVRRAS